MNVVTYEELMKMILRPAVRDTVVRIEEDDDDEEYGVEAALEGRFWQNGWLMTRRLLLEKVLYVL